MEAYVTKSVDAKRVVSPNDSLLLESANNVVIDTDVDRILIEGVRLRDYVQRTIFQRGGASTHVTDLEASSSAAGGARTNFDAIYSGRGEFRTEETRCTGLDASGSFIDVDRSHVITLEGANELRMNAKSIDNIYVRGQTLREVIYALMNEYRLENSYAISSFEDVPVERASFGRESAHMGTAHTNTLVTYKITTNHTLIEGEQPDLVIRSAAGVHIDSPNFYLNNQLFQEYIKQFLDERAFFTLTVDTNPGSSIDYEILNFAVVEHGSIFDYKVRLFMYKEDITSEEVESGVGVPEDESSHSNINLNKFPDDKAGYEKGASPFDGTFMSVTPGSVYNMYADFLNLTTMTLVPKVHVASNILTVVLKSFRVSILNETYLKIVVDMYEEDLAYGSDFKFNLLLNKSNVPDPPPDNYLSGSYLFEFPPNEVYDSNNFLCQTKAGEPEDTINGVFIYDQKNSQLLLGDYIEQPYLYSDRTALSNYVINFNSNQTFRLYNPILEIFSPESNIDPITVTSNSYKDHFSNNLIESNGPMDSTVSSFNEIRYDSNSSNYIITMNASNLSDNWPTWKSETYEYAYAGTSNVIPKFEYIQFVCSASLNGQDYFIENVSNVIKYRIDFSNQSDNDMEIHIPSIASLDPSNSLNPSMIFSELIEGAGASDTTFILQYQDIYGFFRAPHITGANFVLSSLKNMGSISAPTLANDKTYTIVMSCTRPSFEIVDIKISNTGTSFASNLTDYNITNNGINFTVQVPDHHQSKTLYTECTIMDDLERSHVYSNSASLGNVAMTIQTTAAYSSSPRIFTFTVKNLTDAFGVVPSASDGSFSTFTATNDLRAALVTIRSPVSGSIVNGSVTGNFTADNIMTSNVYTIAGVYIDKYGFRRENSAKITINAPSFSTPAISTTATLRTFTISVTAGTLANYQWFLGTTAKGSNSNQLFNNDDAGEISCSTKITNTLGFFKTITTSNIIPSTFRSTTDSSNSFVITGSSSFIATIRVGSSNYTYYNSRWSPSITDIFDYKIVGKSNGTSTWGTTGITSQFNKYRAFDFKFKTYTPTGFVSSSTYAYNKEFNPTNPQAVQTTSNTENYFDVAISVTDEGTNGTPDITPTYQIKYSTTSDFSSVNWSNFTLAGGVTLSSLSHSTDYYYKIKKVIPPDSYNYTHEESSNFTVSTLTPDLPKAPSIDTMTVSETAISVTFASNSNGTPEMTPTYSLFYIRSGTTTETAIASGVSSSPFTNQTYNRSEEDVIKLEKVIQAGFSQYGFLNTSVTKTLDFTPPTRSNTPTISHFANYTKIEFTTTTTSSVHVNSSYTFSFEDGSSEVASITYNSYSAAANDVGEADGDVVNIEFSAHAGIRLETPWVDNRSEVFTQSTNNYVLYTTLSAASVTANILLKSVFGIAATTSDGVTYTYSDVTVDTDIRGFTDLGHITLSNDSNYITKVRVANIYSNDEYYFRNSLRDDVRSNIVIKKGDVDITLNTDNTAIINVGGVDYVYIINLEPGTASTRNYSCAYSIGSFTSPGSNFTDINIGLPPEPTFNVSKVDNNFNFTFKIRGVAVYYPSDVLITSIRIVNAIPNNRMWPEIYDSTSDDELDLFNYSSSQDLNVSNNDVGDYYLKVRVVFSAASNTRWRTSAASSNFTIFAPTAPTFLIGDVDKTTLGALKFAYSNFAANSHEDFTSLFTGYTVSVDMGGDITKSDSVTVSGGEAILSGLSNNYEYIVLYSKTYSNSSANDVTATLTVKTRAFVARSNPTNLTLTSITQGLNSLEWKLDSVDYNHNDSGDPAKFAWGIRADGAALPTWGEPVEWTSTNLASSETRLYLSTSTIYTIFFALEYPDDGIYLNASTTLSTLTPPTAPSWNGVYRSNQLGQVTLEKTNFSITNPGDFSDTPTYTVTINSVSSSYTGSIRASTFSDLTPNSNYDLTIEAVWTNPMDYSNSSNYTITPRDYEYPRIHLVVGSYTPFNPSLTPYTIVRLQYQLDQDRILPLEGDARDITFVELRFYKRYKFFRYIDGEWQDTGDLSSYEQFEDIYREVTDTMRTTEGEDVNLNSVGIQILLTGNDNWSGFYETPIAGDSHLITLDTTYTLAGNPTELRQTHEFLKNFDDNIWTSDSGWITLDPPPS